jgi:excisionase family DNA binding protein
MTQETTPKQLTLEDLSRQLARLEWLTTMNTKTIFDLDEAALFTGYSKGHLYRLTSARKIPHYKKSVKLYFKKSELEAWMTEDRVATRDEINRRAEEYCFTHKRKF